MVELSAGKLRNLMSLADEEGRFKMMAIDQRGSLQNALAKVMGRDPKEVPYEAIASTKQIITRSLAPYATAVLTDPIYGYPYSITEIPGHIGVLLAYEHTGYDKAGPEGKERKSKLIEDWSVRRARKAGANAVKLLLYYHPDASEETRNHQQALVRQVGQECTEEDVPFLLETVGYALDEPSTDSPEYAKRKPDIVIRSAAEFSKPEYQVDILKLEFPADLKYTKEFAYRVFDDKEREPVYTLDDVRAFCRQLHEASRVPWVILSAGVDIKEFLVNVELAVEAGASGFLCGRAIWKDAVSFYPDLSSMEAFLDEEGAYNFMRANAAAEKALPWFEHPHFGGAENVGLKNLSPHWYQDYR